MAAITLKQGDPGYIDIVSGLGADAADKSIDALRVRYNSHPLQGGQWFETVDASGMGNEWKVSTYGTILELPRESDDSDYIPMAIPWRGFKKAFASQQYQLGTQILRSMIEDQIKNVATKMAGGLMNAYRVLQEHSFAYTLNNSQTAAIVGADGVSLANTAHPFERRQQGTWSNVSTAAALTHANYNIMRLAIRKRTDEYGDRQPLMPRQLVIPVDLETKAKEIFQSEKVDDTALNTKNVIKGNVEPFVYNWFTSTTKWMLWSNRDLLSEDKGLHHVVMAPATIRPTTGRDKSSNVINGKYIRTRFVDGFSHGKAWQDNSGA